MASARTQFMQRANTALKEKGLPEKLASPGPTNAIPTRGPREDPESLSDPFLIKRRQLLISHPDLYAKLNLHPLEKQADQEYLEKVSRSRGATKTETLILESASSIKKEEKKNYLEI